MLGTRLSDRYELLSELGRGGMGYVYRAYDPILKRDVAVKLIPPLRLARETADRFHREAQVVAQMDHPSIVPIHDYGRHDGALFFVMPLVEGATLRSSIDEGRLPLGTVVQIGAQIAEALDYSQSRGIIHRDVKPENVMVTWERGDLRVRVMDFGLARDLDDGRLTQSDGLLMGTPAYLSPEQVAGRKVDFRSDLYALGVVLYECLVGEPPFVGPLHTVVASITHDAPVPIRDRGLEVDAELDRLVSQCLAKDPAQRPASGRDFAADLLSYWQGLHDSQRLRLVLPGGAPSERQQEQLTLVGRLSEMASLESRLSVALDGECQVVLMGGEAGTGKTRLLRELERRLRHRTIHVLWGRFAERQSASPFSWFLELLQGRFRGDEERSASGRPEVDLSDLAPDLLQVFPSLGEIPALRSAAEDGTSHSGKALQESPPGRDTATQDDWGSSRFFELLASVLIRIGGGEPMVLLLDNLQHGDDSLDALQYIVRRMSAAPTLVVGAYRSSEVDRGHALERFIAAFRDDPRLTQFPIQPLEPEAFEKLVGSLVGSDHLDAALVQSLFEATEGNPFFAKELVRSLNESGGLRLDDSRGWVLVRDVGLSTRALPATMQQAIEKRIEQLRSEQQKILSFASVLGKSFDFRDLAQLMGEAASVDLEDGVDALVSQGMLVEEAEGRGDRLSFSSGITRDLLYGELPRRRRRTLHRQHAVGLEQRWQGRLERVYPQLVHHFYEGDVAEKTVQYALLLARDCLDAWSPEDAMRACKKALEFVEEEEVDDATRRRAELWSLVAEAQWGQGKVGEALRRAERSFALFHQLDELQRAAQIATLAARASWQARRSEETRRWVRKGAELARRSQDDALLRELLDLGTTVANLRGEHLEARQMEDEAAQLTEVPRHPPVGEPELAAGGRLVTVIPGELNTFDPADLFADWQAEVAVNVFETLIDSDGDGHLRPNLCSHWQGDDSGQRFVFTLRPRVCFADGKPLAALHVKESLQRAARKEGRRPAAALWVITGMKDYVSGSQDDVVGLQVDDAGRLVVLLDEPLPNFPALLTDPGTAVVREVPSTGGSGHQDMQLIGTGPFCLADPPEDNRIVLERSPHPWGGRRAPLDTVEFLCGLSPTEVADGLRSGRIDIARDLLSADLEEVLRESRFLEGLVEATKRNVYFAMFNLSSSMASRGGLRRALLGVLRTHDLVWRTLGRFAQPAVCFIPPGMLGHNPGRRRLYLSRKAAEKMLESTGLRFPIRLRAAIQPLLVERYGALLQEVFSLWRDLGVEVEAVTPTMESYIAAWRDSRDVDLILGRWNADFDDPDTFTHFLFNSRDGLLRHYFSSPLADRLLAHARREKNGERRQRLLGRFEDLLEEHGVLLPLFHDIDYRIAGPSVRQLRLGNRPPYVDYSFLAKVDTVQATEVRTSEGELHVPMAGRLETLDPAGANMLEQAEVLPSIFETLTRIDSQARVIPWLAEDFHVEEGGRAYRFRLRPGTRFHDGRRLTARDVRYSFERVLRRSHDEAPGPPVYGTAGLARTGIRELTRLQIVSATEFVFELGEPLAIFPTLLSHPSFAIVPEDTETFDGRWREGAVGTGPFRIVRFEKGRRLDLEGNPDYWRSGFPRSHRLVFHCGKSATWIRDELRAGRLALATDLDAQDVEILRRDPKLAPGFRQAPRLSTYFLALNAHSGPLADALLRRAFQQALGLDELASLLSPLSIKADGLLPPGLLGYEEPMLREEKPVDVEALRGVRIRMAVNPAYRVLYGGFWAALQRRFRAMGLEIDEVEGSNAEIIEKTVRGEVDVVAQRWIADYPDPDSFVMGLLHSRDGVLSRLCGSDDLDGLLETARREADPTLRHTLYQEVEEILQGRQLLLPLFHEQTYRFAHPSVEGLRLTGLSVPEVQYDELEWRG